MATGIEEHNNYVVDFINATRRIRQTRPMHTSRGVIKCLFFICDNNPVSEAMHSVFLHHAVKAGTDKGILMLANLKCTTKFLLSKRSGGERDPKLS